jgi:hypothetical protein
LRDAHNPRAAGALRAGAAADQALAPAQDLQFSTAPHGGPRAATSADGADGGADEAVAYRDLCWRYAGAAVKAKMAARSLAAMRALRRADRARAGRLAWDAVRAALVQPGVGLSTQEAALLLALVARTERGRAPEVAIDDLLLCRAELVPGDARWDASAYAAWLALEAAWEHVAERFWSFDLSFDGRLSASEFHAGVLSLRLPGLLAAGPVQACVEELLWDRPGAGEAFISLEAFMWRMASGRLAAAAARAARRIVECFRAEADGSSALDRGLSRKWLGGAPQPDPRIASEERVLERTQLERRILTVLARPGAGAPPAGAGTGGDAGPITALHVKALVDRMIAVPPSALSRTNQTLELFSPDAQLPLSLLVPQPASPPQHPPTLQVPVASAPALEAPGAPPGSAPTATDVFEQQPPRVTVTEAQVVGPPHNC